MTRSWFQAIDSDDRDVTSELLSFAKMIGLETVIPRRYSALLLFGLYGGTQSGMLNPAKVVSQIKSLEDNGKGIGLKCATQFERPPLQGLWHQHYLEDGLPSMARNLRKGIGKHGLPWLEEQVAEAKATNKEKYLTETDCARIAYDAVWSNWERLRNNSELTGEWIIFAKYQGDNYYLGLGKHRTGDEVLRSQIDAICLNEFPFLKEILIA